MIPTTIPLLLAALSSATAQMLARQVPQVSEERSVRPSGGWALLAQDGKFCPNDLAICGTDTYCCPTNLTCQAFGGPTNLCCPGRELCFSLHHLRSIEKAKLTVLTSQPRVARPLTKRHPTAPTTPGPSGTSRRAASTIMAISAALQVSLGSWIRSALILRRSLRLR